MNSSYPVISNFVFLYSGTKSGIKAIVDIVSKDILSWSGNRGEEVTRTPLNEGDALYDEVQKLHDRLVDRLAALDDELAECVLTDDSLSKVGVVAIYNALRRVTINRVRTLYSARISTFFVTTSCKFSESCGRRVRQFV